MNRESKTRRFESLVHQAAACRWCPRLADQPAVLGPQNGSLEAKVVFVAEAPGRLGAGKTGIPFSGDRSGQNFDRLLASAGLTREEVFITNAALCTPLAEGRNRRPTLAEIKNCAFYLQAVLDLVRPRLVVTLGAVGLEALNRLLGEKRSLSRVAGQPFGASGFTVLPLYHPSPRVMTGRRPLAMQKIDFQKIRPLLSSAEAP